MKRLLISLCCLFPVISAHSQIPPDFYNPAVIRHKMQGLGVTASVLYIAAHPDDENTRLITYLTKDKHYRVGYLSLTRGDGGQNLIGNEQGTGLGVLRTEELLAARRTDGAEQYFTRAYDFGYSKDPDETFIKWNKAEVLKDVVTIIRRFKPDVIICRFPTTGEGGHGHHTASAILAEEAFTLAADKKYTDHCRQEPWQAARLLWNTFNFGTTNTIDSTQFRIDVGGYNSTLGKSYGEISAESRSQHRSQGFGSAKQRGEQWEYFKVIKTTKGIALVHDLMDGINTGWSRFDELNRQEESKAGLLPGKAQEINKAVKSVQDSKPENQVNALLELRQLINSIHIDVFYNECANDWRHLKLREIDELIVACSGLWVDVLAQKPQYITGDSVSIELNLLNRGNETWAVKSFGPVNMGIPANMKYLKLDTSRLLYNKARKEIIKLAPFYIPLQPHWLRSPMQGNLFESLNCYNLSPVNAQDLEVQVILTCSGKEVKLKLPLSYKRVDPSIGEVYQPLLIVPPVTVTPVTPVVAVTGKNNKLNIPVKLKANSKKQSGVLTYNIYKNGSVQLSGGEFVDLDSGKEKIQNVQINYPLTEGTVQVEFIFLAEDSVKGTASLPCKYATATIDYPHIRRQDVFYPAMVKVVSLPFSPKVKKIAYISGAGDKVADCLRQLGYQVDELNEEHLTMNDLSQYPVIITGVRAHNTREDLQAAYPRLMDYVKNGGRLIVQYNTNNRIGPVIAQIGPYPFTISRDRVTDEQATVTFTNPADPFLNKPNKITAADFEGWIQERSIYQVSQRDSSNYKTLFSMADPNEKASDGSLIYCRYGKGTFIYTGLVFFRELPAGVPGAYRLFINLIEAKQ